MKVISRKNIINALKIAGGCIISVIIATLLKLSYSASAGIITILSIQATKKETIQVALKRLTAFVAAVVIAAVCFGIFGYNILAFAVYMFIYIFICIIFRWQSAMAVNSVLITHFWAAQSMSLVWILNETAIFLIGVTVGILINLSLRANLTKIDRQKKMIEDDMRHILKRMSAEILSSDKSEYKGDCFEKLNEHIADAEKVVNESIGNSYSRMLRDELSYILMRKNQAVVLKKIYDNVLHLNLVPSQIFVVADFIDNLSEHIFAENDVNVNIKELQDIFLKMKDEPLPKTREEFENRAILFHILYQFEEFLMIKRNSFALED